MQLSLVLVWFLVATVGHVASAATDKSEQPSLQVAVRQPLLDYSTTVGLEALQKFVVEEIEVPPVETKFNVPLVGDVTLAVKSLKCVEFEEEEEKAHISIDKNVFHASAEDLTAVFTYKWHWKASNLPISGSGSGEAEFVGGNVSLHFQVADEGRIMILVTDADASFDDIKVVVTKSPLGWLYNAILNLFHQGLMDKITDQIKVALKHEIPKQINAYLSDLPSTVVIEGLPVAAAFKYALYTHGFVLVSAFPTIGLPTTVATSTPRGALSDGRLHRTPEVSPTDPEVSQQVYKAHLRAGAEAISTYSDTDPHAASFSTNGDPLESVASVLAASFWPRALGELQSSKPVMNARATTEPRMSTGLPSNCKLHDGHGVLDAQQWWVRQIEACPAGSVSLNVTDAEILADEHMATAYVNDALPQCLLWGLYNQGLLEHCAVDGDVPGVRLITELFQVLIPGIYQDYPHRSLGLTLNVTSEPKVKFVPGKGMFFEGTYETIVYVQPNTTHGGAGAAHTGSSMPAPPDPAHRSCSGPGAVKVAVLEATVSGVANMQYKTTVVPQLEVKYTIKESPYKIRPAMWERTIKYVVAQVQPSLSIEKVWRQLVHKEVASRVHVDNAAGTYADGWYKLSTDFQVDL